MHLPKCSIFLHTPCTVSPPENQMLETGRGRRQVLHGNTAKPQHILKLLLSQRLLLSQEKLLQQQPPLGKRKVTLHMLQRGQHSEYAGFHSCWLWIEGMLTAPSPVQHAQGYFSSGKHTCNKNCCWLKRSHCPSSLKEPWNSAPLYFFTCQQHKHGQLQ